MSSQRERSEILRPFASDSTRTHLNSRILSASSSDVHEAIAHAHDVFQSGIWSRTPPISRSKVLSRLARALETRIPEFAKLDTLQTGRAIREMNAQLSRLPEWLWVLPHLL
jgi:acyl-CoA reductase-like NAD-dependent aldehyde dehydrogenase